MSQLGGGEIDRVPRIPTEALVAAVAVQRDRDVFPSHLRDVERRDGRVVRERLAVVADDAGDELERAGLDDELVVLGRKAVGDEPRQRKLVELLAGEAYGEGLDRLAGGLSHRGNHCRRVDAPREEGAERYVGDQPPRGRRSDVLAQLLLDLALIATPPLPREVELPVPGDRGATVLVDEGAAGWQLADRAERGHRRRYPAVCQVGVQGLVIYLTRHLFVLQERCELGAEGQAPGVQRVVQRLLADAVAGQEEPPLPRVPYGQSEHAVQAMDQRRASVFVEMGDGLGIALSREAVPGAFKLTAQLAVVVDLSVEDDGNRAVLVEDRLVAGGQIDHAQALDP